MVGNILCAVAMLVQLQRSVSLMLNVATKVDFFQRNDSSIDSVTLPWVTISVHILGFIVHYGWVCHGRSHK